MLEGHEGGQCFELFTGRRGRGGADTRWRQRTWSDPLGSRSLTFGPAAEFVVAGRKRVAVEVDFQAALTKSRVVSIVGRQRFTFRVGRTEDFLNVRPISTVVREARRRTAGEYDRKSCYQGCHTCNWW